MVHCTRPECQGTAGCKCTSPWPPQHNSATVLDHDAAVERMAACLFCHAQFKGDVYTARTVSRRLLELALTS
jgi:hypothetical protein